MHDVALHITTVPCSSDMNQTQGVVKTQLGKCTPGLSPVIIFLLVHSGLHILMVVSCLNADLPSSLSNLSDDSSPHPTTLQLAVVHGVTPALSHQIPQAHTGDYI